MRTLSQEETNAVGGAGWSDVTFVIGEVGGAVLRTGAQLGNVLLKSLGATLGWFSRELG